MSLHINTPLIASTSLSARTGREVWLKLDALQPAGSFKIRGVGLACQTYQERGARRFVSSSGGNAGLAVAYAGRQLGVPVTVVVPQTTTERAKSLIAAEGAQVQVHGTSWVEANAHAQSLLDAQSAFIHPFDDPLLWQGHASLVDEVAAAGLQPDLIVLSVGGGGLLCGVLAGLARNGWSDIPVLAMETMGADSLAQALATRSHVTLPAIRSIATSLGARQVCRQAFEQSQRLPVRSAVVDDRAAVEAALAFADDHRVIVEPACGAALAAVYQNLAALEAAQRVLVVVCGGVGASHAQLVAWQQSL